MATVRQGARGWADVPGRAVVARTGHPTRILGLVPVVRTSWKQSKDERAEGNPALGGKLSRIRSGGLGRVRYTERMTDGPLLRLLDMVRRELGAEDARVEIGGEEPAEPRVLWVRLSESRRVVVRFAEPPQDRDGLKGRLLALVEAYAGTATPSKSRRRGPPGALTQALLNEQLGMLAERLDAIRIVVIDDVSPVVWGSSDPFQRSEHGVEEAMRTARVVASSAEAGIDFAELLVAGIEEAGRRLGEAGVSRELTGGILREIGLLRAERVVMDEDGWRAVVIAARAIAHMRHRPVLQAVPPRARRVLHGEGFGLLAKPFASSYWLVAAFDGSFSELHVEGAVVRVLPRVERLVLALPPLDPPPSKARVLRLRRPK